MELTDDFERLPLDKIVVRRDARQRRELFDSKGQFLDEDGLLASVRERGVMSPLLVRRETMELVYGERRYTAARLVGHTSVPVRYVEDLDTIDAMVLELEENVKRKALAWRDEVRAVATLHSFYKERERQRGNVTPGGVPKWSVEDSVKALGYGQVNIAIRVAQELDNPLVKGADGVRAAYNALTRQDDRRTADLVSDIIDGTQDVFARGDVSAIASDPSVAGHDTYPLASERPPISATRPAALPAQGVADAILCADFIQWAGQYSGPTFNFIHCDFPYGIGVFSGPQSGRQTHMTYGDDDATYWALIDALGTNLDRICSHSAHLMFWTSADVRRIVATLDAFRRCAPSLIFDTFPLVWHKTDNIGILPDAKRGPRRVYEIALVASREDRLIVRAVSNAYGAPTDKTYHTSTKPEPVLRHWFQMFVDEHTRLLDPTCGSGSALRAAESLGAKHVLGLESNPEHVKSAQTALRQFRTLRVASRVA